EGRDLVVFRPQRAQLLHGTARSIEDSSARVASAKGESIGVPRDARGAALRARYQEGLDADPIHRGVFGARCALHHTHASGGARSPGSRCQRLWAAALVARTWRTE